MFHCQRGFHADMRYICAYSAYAHIIMINAAYAEMRISFPKLCKGICQKLLSYFWPKNFLGHFLKKMFGDVTFGEG